VRDAHAVHRRLVGELGQAPGLGLRKGVRQRLGRFVAAHQEFARRHAHEAHAGQGGDGRRWRRGAAGQPGGEQQGQGGE
jgi:hypothetical protein